MIRHPWEGRKLPEEIDHEEVLKVAKKYIEPLVSTQSSWDAFERSFCFGPF